MTKTGASAVIAAAVGQAAESLAGDRAAAEGEQLALLEIPTRFEGAEAEKIRAKLEREHSGRGVVGRPKGAENRATRQFREWLLAVGADPHVNMMRWSLHTPETLAKELGCTKLEAFRELRALWDALGGVIRPKLAPVGDDGKPVPFFQMMLGVAASAGVTGDLPPWLSDPDVAKQLEAQAEQNQALSADETGRRDEQAPTSEG